MSGPLRLGLVGAGRWGRIYLRTLAGRSDGRIVRLASSNPESAALAGGDCVVSPHWRELVAAGDLDGLIIASPPNSHGEIAMAALDRRLPVLVEKPLTMDAAEAEAILTKARACGVHAAVDHIHLYSPAFRRLAQMAVQAGPIRSIRTRAGNHGPYRSDTPVLWDWGSHDAAMILALMGRAPDHAAATVVERRDAGGGLGEILRLDLTFGTVPAEIVIGTLMDKCRRLEVECAGATLVYDDLAPAKLTQDGKAVEISAELPLFVAVGEFCAAIRAGSNDLSGIEMGLKVVRLLSDLGRSLP